LLFAEGPVILYHEHVSYQRPIIFFLRTTLDISAESRQHGSLGTILAKVPNPSPHTKTRYPKPVRFDPEVSSTDAALSHLISVGGSKCCWLRTPVANSLVCRCGLLRSSYNLARHPVMTRGSACPIFDFPELVSGLRVATLHSGSPTLLVLQPLNTRSSTHAFPPQPSLTPHHPVISACNSCPSYPGYGRQFRPSISAASTQRRPRAHGRT